MPIKHCCEFDVGATVAWRANVTSLNTSHDLKRKSALDILDLARASSIAWHVSSKSCASADVGRVPGTIPEMSTVAYSPPQQDTATFAFSCPKAKQRHDRRVNASWMANGSSMKLFTSNASLLRPFPMRLTACVNSSLFNLLSRL